MILGVSVTKQTSWRGIQEQFSNVYHYDAAVDVTSKQVADSVVNNEKGLFGASVAFKNVKVWGPADGTKEQSQMLLQEDLTGNGSGAAGSQTAKELSAVVSWDTGRVNSRGGRIFLRKYLHLGNIQGTDEAAAKGNTTLPQADISSIEAYGSLSKNVVGVSGASICDKKGRKLPPNTPAVVLPHLHTRQFRR
jgi:hypothetical protein